MRDRASVANLALSLGAFFVFMWVLLAAGGFGIGTVELTIWLVLVLIGAWLIVRRFRTARRDV